MLTSDLSVRDPEGGSFPGVVAGRPRADAGSGQQRPESGGPHHALRAGMGDEFAQTGKRLRSPA